ncbi:hypothetical protein HU200_040816 [Digitaria exilis]|uniref:O-methyltransferase C-terminal domain-containing protein n=1 Tax=Digitaria exilis TaxID=1010633 RepID=A0A835BD09_9POAL|nr:hypothetical protein HU200_040816 [Digitaria exilis]
MTFLATSGIFREKTHQEHGVAAPEPYYHLTTASRLLVDDEDTTRGGHPCISQLLAMCSSPFIFTASLNLDEWLKEEEDARTPFAMAHGAGVYDVVRRNAAFGSCFDEAMASDSRFVSEIVVRDYGKVFAGVTSVVDVGGHNGTMARAIAKAFPHVTCSVLELPRVVDAMPADGTVEFIAGDMREFIPPAE